MIREEDKHILDENLIIKQEEASRGTEKYWLNLINFDDMMKYVTAVSKQSPADQTQ